MPAKLKAVPKTPTLQFMARQWLAAKAREQKANAERIAIEETLVKMLPKPDDSNTANGSIGDIKVAVSYGTTVKVDTEKLKASWDALTPKAQGAFRWKAEPDTKVVNGLREFAPQDYSTIVPYLTVTPRKPSVAVEVL